MKNEELNRIIDDMMYSFETLINCKNQLDEMGGKIYAKKLDTILGKLYNLMIALNDKSKN